MLPALFKSWQKKIIGTSTLRSLRSKQSRSVSGLASKGSYNKNYESLEEGDMPLTTVSAVPRGPSREELGDDKSPQIHVARDFIVESKQYL